MGQGNRVLRPRRLDDLPPAESFETEFPCPVDRFAELTLQARKRGTLPKLHAAVRRRALTEALTAGYTAYEVARRAAIDSTRAYQLKKAAAALS